MPYIDYSYYVERTGDDQTPREDIECLLGPASDIIDEIALYRIGDSLEGYNAPTQEVIRKACAAQVQYLNDNGGRNAVINGVPKYSGSVTIGSFRYGDGRLTDTEQTGLTDNRFSRWAVKLLHPTGLLYTGVSRARDERE